MLRPEANPYRKCNKTAVCNLQRRLNIIRTSSIKFVFLAKTGTFPFPPSHSPATILKTIKYCTSCNFEKDQQNQGPEGGTLKLYMTEFNCNNHHSAQINGLTQFSSKCRNTSFSSKAQVNLPHSC
ncbi:hypothetical protein O6H91_11G092200 [Diphasiastrum complanatum]|uniref:Uncharacterized protein n=1 Tax=Diphasiastrum complanatum TaxID=34168 RepID=A0ACC2CC12_DIPCM|nr:hypothetical protein O6H91_11G092200 [Diphasiastrum complanatum]